MAYPTVKAVNAQCLGLQGQQSRPPCARGGDPRALPRISRRAALLQAWIS